MTASDEILFLNGEYMPLSQGRISVEDRGFQFADGIYETIRIVNGRAFRLDEHLRRLEESAAAIRLRLEYDRAAMEDICRELLNRSALQEGVIYIQVTRGAAPRQHLPPNLALRPTTLAYTRASSQQTVQQWEHGLTTWFHLDDRWAHCNVKTIALIANELGRLDAQSHGADEVVFCSAEGIVRECGSANIFCVIQGKVYTPPLSERILPGVTRQVTLEACKELGIPAFEEALKKEEYLSADEVFLTSTSRNALPIRAMDGHPIGSGESPITKKINEGIVAIVERETK